MATSQTDTCDDSFIRLAATLRHQMKEAASNKDFVRAGKLQAEVIEMETRVRHQMEEAAAQGNYILAGKLQKRLQDYFENDNDETGRSICTSEGPPDAGLVAEMGGPRTRSLEFLEKFHPGIGQNLINPNSVFVQDQIRAREYHDSIMAACRREHAKIQQRATGAATSSVVSPVPASSVSRFKSHVCPVFPFANLGFSASSMYSSRVVSASLAHQENGETTSKPLKKRRLDSTAASGPQAKRPRPVSSDYKVQSRVASFTNNEKASEGQSQVVANRNLKDAVRTPSHDSLRTPTDEWLYEWLAQGGQFDMVPNACIPKDKMKPFDVLGGGSGRGGFGNGHLGDIRFRNLVNQVKAFYESSKKKEKTFISWVIVDCVLASGGRFLKAVSTLDENNKKKLVQPLRFLLMTADEARGKAASALREAPHRGAEVVQVAAVKHKSTYKWASASAKGLKSQHSYQSHLRAPQVDLVKVLSSSAQVAKEALGAYNSLSDGVCVDYKGVTGANRSVSFSFWREGKLKEATALLKQIVIAQIEENMAAAGAENQAGESTAQKES